MDVIINDQQVSVTAGMTILEAARGAGIYIPALCSHPEVPSGALTPEAFIYQGKEKIFHEGAGDVQNACGLCGVEIQGREEIVKACDTLVEDAMVIFTETDAVRNRRKARLKEILSHHPNICLTCDRVPRCPPFGVCVRSANVPDRCVACPGYATCELIRVADHIGMIGTTIPREPVEFGAVEDNPFFEFDPKLCVGCARCVRFCKDVRGIGALGVVVREGRIHTGTIAETFLSSGCRFCFGCVEVCPTGALVDKTEKWKERKAVEERKKDIVPCMAACPLHIDIPGYIHHVAHGRYDEAFSVIEKRLPFVSLCGTVCTHPCETVCRRAEMDQAVAIKDLKRFVAERARATAERPRTDPSGKRVAIIGSGPAGMAAAYFLRKKAGHFVTVYESLPRPGGTPYSGIPRFRLPQTVIDDEIEKMRRLGVDIVTDTHIDSAGSLLAAGFDAVLLSFGAHEEIRLGIEGETHPAVTGAIDLLRKVSLGVSVALGEQVAVIGGGNVALDAARVAKRIGARDVTVVYRRSINEMPAAPEEIEQTAEEGIRFVFLAAPVRYESADGKVRVTCIRHELKRPDASGRRRPKPVKGSEFFIDVDSVITAVGQTVKMPEELHADADEKGRVKVDAQSFMTGRPGIFAAGDAVSGPKTVTEAVAMGIRAANAINRYLGGEELMDMSFFSPSPLPPRLDQSEAFADRRVSMPLLSAEARQKGFEQVELGYSEEMALREANRCLRCSLRLHMRKG